MKILAVSAAQNLTISSLIWLLFEDVMNKISSIQGSQIKTLPIVREPKSKKSLNLELVAPIMEQRFLCIK